MTRQTKHDIIKTTIGGIEDIRVTIKRDGEWRMRAGDGWD